MGEWGIGRTASILLVIIVLVILIFSGKELYAGTKESVAKVFPGGEYLLNKLIPEKPPSREMEEDDADEIHDIIENTINKMEKDNDCIEAIDFSDINKEFILEFNQVNGGTELLVYKMNNDKMERRFDRGFTESITPLGGADDLSKNFERVLYKDEKGAIFLINSEDKNYGYLIYRQICSTGEYSGIFDFDDLNYFNRVVINYNDKYTKVPKESKYGKYYPGVYVKEKELWKRIEGDKDSQFISRDRINMGIHINKARDFRFKVNLYKISETDVRTVRG